ncbi:iron-sulfur cluster assembly protein [Nocardioides oleivorans]|uniref:Iron-sulfur cluster assembly protein n=2 Tax=Nocardioides oleivorans TaxID=273676 RepID=A0A4V1RKG1_9ACTN|nr:iron-sulfur cluster assembly protein [Nocardioides oleivorans]
MTATRHTHVEAVREALDAVFDPELDEPITDLGFVRSVTVDEAGSVEVHLRLPTSFCSPNFAYLMASDSKDVLTRLDWSRSVTVWLDDHHDSDIINHGLATDAGYKGTFRHEADNNLDELRHTFQVKAHTAAMERCLTALLRSNDDLAESALGDVVLGDLPEGPEKESLLRRRTTLRLGNHPSARVMVDEHGVGYEPDQVPMALRRARSTRISIDGNAHFCRGLLRTRYPDSREDQTRRVDGEEPADEQYAGYDATFIPLTTLTTHSGKEHSR